MMSEFFTYFLKVNVALAVFYILFRVVFYRDTFWVGRRVYLISAIVISALYPLISLSGWLESREPIQVFIAEWTPIAISEFIVFQETEAAITTNPFTWQQMLSVVYIGISTILLLRFFVQLFSILFWRKRSRKAFIHNASVRTLSKDIAPFSFFKSIYINPDSHSEHELKEVLAHESTHVRQWHSVDVLLGELFTIVCWANPFAWLLKAEIRQNLEFLADNNVVKSGFNAKKYQYHLTELALYSPNIQITNRFNVSSLKKRITMMNRRESKKTGLIKYALILPVTLTLVLWSNAEVVSSSVMMVVENMAVEQQNHEEVNTQTEQESKFLLLIENTENGVNITSSKGTAFTELTFTLREGQAQEIDQFGMRNPDDEVRENDNLASFRITIRKTKETLYLEGTKGTAFTKLSFSSPIGSKQLINQNGMLVITEQQMPLPPATQRSGIMEIQQQMPEFPGGKEAKMKFLSENIRYPVIAQENGIQGRIVAQFDVQSTGKISDVKIVNSVDPTLDREVIRIIERMPDWTPGEHNGNKVNVRQTFSVLFRLQGGGVTTEIPAEPNDIVVVAYAAATTNNAPQPSTSNNISTVNNANRTLDLREFSTSGVGNPLVVVDDVVKDADFDFNSIPPSDIRLFAILKDENAIALYGEQGKNGVIKIYTINSSKDLSDRRAGWQDRMASVSDVGSPIIITTERSSGNIVSVSRPNENIRIGDLAERPLYVINDEIKDVDFDLSTINPDDIESISVLKGEAATTAYGEKGKDGVIIITLLKK
jgi:TonB family protein